MEGDVGSVPAGKFWTALILVCLDTGARLGDVMRTRLTDYRRGEASLTRTATSEPICLFDWPWDNGKQPFHMLLRNYKTLLYRAGLPHVRYNMFDRLSVTAREREEAGLFQRSSRLRADLCLRPRNSGSLSSRPPLALRGEIQQAADVDLPTGRLRRYRCR